MENVPRLANDSTVELAGNRRSLVFYNGSGSTIAKGDWVQIDTSVTTYGLGNAIKQAAASADGPLVCGLCDKAAIPTGKWGEVLVDGVSDDDAAVADAAVAGDLLQQSATAGRAEVAGAVTQRSVGVALSDGTASNTARVYVRCG